MGTAGVAKLVSSHCRRFYPMALRKSTVFVDIADHWWALRTRLEGRRRRKEDGRQGTGDRGQRSEGGGGKGVRIAGCGDGRALREKVLR